MIQTTSCRPQRFLLLLLAVMIINKRVVVHLAPALQRLCLHCHFLLCRSQNLFPVVEGEWRPSPTLLSDPLFVPTDKTFQRVAAAAAAAPDRRLILQLAPNPLLQGALQQHRMPDLPTAMIALVTLFLSLSLSIHPPDYRQIQILGHDPRTWSSYKWSASRGRYYGGFLMVIIFLPNFHKCGAPLGFCRR